MKALPDKTLEHYCALHPVAMTNPDSPIDVSGINPSCIRAMYVRGLIEYEFISVNGKTERRILFTKEGLKYGCEILALVPDSNSDNRKREVLRVYLDMRNEDHQTAWDIARSLAGERILTPTLVDLLLMHSEFLDKNATTFAEAYPAMYKLMTETREGDLLKRIESLLQSAPRNAISGVNQGAAFGLRAMSYDDDNDTVELDIHKDTQSAAIATKNFLASMERLNGVKLQAPESQGIKQLAVASVPMPVFEDD